MQVAATVLNKINLYPVLRHSTIEVPFGCICKKNNYTFIEYSQYAEPIFETTPLVL